MILETGLSPAFSRPGRLAASPSGADAANRRAANFRSLFERPVLMLLILEIRVLVQHRHMVHNKAVASDNQGYHKD